MPAPELMSLDWIAANDDSHQQVIRGAGILRATSAGRHPNNSDGVLPGQSPVVRSVEFRQALKRFHGFGRRFAPLI